MKRKRLYPDFIIDKLTNSVENVKSGDNFATEISLVNSLDIKQITKKNGWKFNWKFEFKNVERTIYKLTILNNSEIIQGLVSLENKGDHIFIHLIESAKFNIGKEKVYYGVPGNLVAFACKTSYENGFEGYVSFISKTKLIDHYIKTLGAQHFGGNLMIINNVIAMSLINKYFKD